MDDRYSDGWSDGYQEGYDQAQLDVALEIKENDRVWINQGKVIEDIIKRLQGLL